MLPRFWRNSAIWPGKPAVIRLPSRSPRSAWRILTRVQRLADQGVARVVASVRSEKAAAVLSIVDRWDRDHAEHQRLNRTKARCRAPQPRPRDFIWIRSTSSRVI